MPSYKELMSSLCKSPMETSEGIMQAGGILFGGTIGSFVAAPLGGLLGAVVSSCASNSDSNYMKDIMKGSAIGFAGGANLGLIAGGAIGGSGGYGALEGVIHGIAGRMAISFFNSARGITPKVDNTTSLNTFAKMGFIATLIKLIVGHLTESTIEHHISDPKAQKLVRNACITLIYLAALNIAARNLGKDPSGSAKTAMMIVPLFINALDTLNSIISNYQTAPTLG